MPTHVPSGLVFRQPQFALLANRSPGEPAPRTEHPLFHPGCVAEPASAEPAAQNKRAPANAKFTRMLLVFFFMIDTSVTHGTGYTLQL